MSDADSHLEDDMVLALVAGHLALAERGLAEAHIDACSECRELVSAVAGERAGSAAAAARGWTLPDEAPDSDDVESESESGLVIGERLADRFVVERHAGGGGMAHVYRARDELTGATVALMPTGRPRGSPRIASRGPRLTARA